MHCGPAQICSTESDGLRKVKETGVGVFRSFVSSVPSAPCALCPHVKSARHVLAVVRVARRRTSTRASECEAPQTCVKQMLLQEGDGRTNCEKDTRTARNVVVTVRVWDLAHTVVRTEIFSRACARRKGSEEEEEGGREHTRGCEHEQMRSVSAASVLRDAARAPHQPRTRDSEDGGR